MKKLSLLLTILLLCCGLTSCQLDAVISPESSIPVSNHVNQVTGETEEESKETREEQVITLEDLKGTEHFTRNALPHIFEGEINKKNKAVGYHSEALEDTPGNIILGTESKPNESGVYTAQVEVNGIKKTSNKGYSTFFPKDWNAQEVVDAINQAYENRQHDSGNTYLGETDDGIIIQMYLTEQGKIISAFPIY